MCDSVTIFGYLVYTLSSLLPKPNGAQDQGTQLLPKDVTIKQTLLGGLL